jgi:altronate dehydratase
MKPEDNCATSLTDIPKDEVIQINGNKTIKINHDIPMGHKFALKNINKGDLIKKYGQIIGVAIEDIKVGDWIHTHNIKSHYLERVVNE